MNWLSALADIFTILGFPIAVILVIKEFRKEGKILNNIESSISSGNISADKINNKGDIINYTVNNHISSELKEKSNEK
ncbi:MAG: hypothetical protein Q7S53_03550 [bacterium]|nr:hypothetical protein [bacterium]